MPRSAIIDPVTFTAKRTGPNGYVGGRTVTVFYQYGHVVLTVRWLAAWIQSQKLFQPILKLLVKFPFLLFLSRVMRCLDWERGSTSARFCYIKTTKLLIFVYSFDSNNKLSDPIVGSLARNESRIFNDFIVGYMKFLAKLPKYLFPLAGRDKTFIGCVSVRFKHEA